MSDKPVLKQRAIITIDNDAVDYVAAADFQRDVEAMTVELQRKYLRANFDVRERRDPRSGEPKPVTVNRRTSRSAKANLDEDV